MATKALSATVEAEAARGPEPAAADRSDAFICYSRRDREFVVRLHAALQAGGKEVYVDWEDIPDWSEDYQSELDRGIDSSDAFVVVLSPDSLASRHCRLELDRSVAEGKRLRPLLHRDVDDAVVPESLRKPQWIDFRDEVEFDSAASRLLEALNVDAEWVRGHTRIGLRAGEWERRGRDGSLLLRGSDLREAETWLGAQAGKEPPPTQRQVEYVLAGRRAATRRNRVTLAAVLVALALAVGLAVLALVQRNRAIEQRDEATSLALAAAAREQLTGRLDVALLLGLAAYDISPTPQAKSTMVSALEAARQLGVATVLGSNRGSATSIAFSPDGQTLAVADIDGPVWLWDVRTRRRDRRPFRGHTGGTYDVAFSRDGRTLASSGSDGTIKLWDVRTRQRLGKPLRPSAAQFNSLAFGSRTVASRSGATVRLWDARTHRQLGRPLRANNRTVWDVAFSHDGQTLATAGEDGAVRLWDVRTQRQLDPPLDGSSGPLETVAFSPDGSTLAAAGEKGTVWLWDLRARPELVRRLRGHTDSVGSVAFSPNGRVLASASLDGTVRIWDVRTGEQIGLPLTGHSVGADSVAFSPDGHTLAFARADEAVRLLDVRTHARLGRALPGRTGALKGIAFSHDGRMLAAAGVETSRLWSTRTHRQLGWHVGNAVAISPDGRTVVTAHEDRTVRLWGLHTGRQLGQPLRGHTDAVVSAAFSPDGRSLATIGDKGRLRLWDVRSHRQVGQPLLAHNGVVVAVTFSPDGRTFATAGGDETVRLWDAATHRQLGAPLTGHTGWVLAVAFSPDGRRLASGGTDKTVRLWDVHTHRQLGQPLRDTDWADGVAFSPDGHTLLSAAQSGTMRLWDVRSHQQLGEPLQAPLEGGASTVTLRVAFHPDGRTFASGGQTVRLWEGILWRDVDDLRTQVCDLVPAGLTRRAWAQYAQGLPYLNTCPT